VDPKQRCREEKIIQGIMVLKWTDLFEHPFPHNCVSKHVFMACYFWFLHSWFGLQDGRPTHFVTIIYSEILSDVKLCN
jgi:hypothetical protein